MSQDFKILLHRTTTRRWGHDPSHGKVIPFSVEGPYPVKDFNKTTSKEKETNETRDKDLASNLSITYRT